VARTPPPSCLCFDLTREGAPASSARYAVRYFLTDLLRDDPTSSAVRARIHAALGRARIPLAIPLQTLSVTAGEAAASGREQDEEALRCAVLEKIELFRSLTAQERLGIARRLVPAPFGRGEIITRQGAEAHWLYLLAEGTADIRVRVGDGDDGRETLVAQAAAPTIFGEMSLMTGEPRRATVRATSPALCYRLDKAGFGEIITQRPEIATEMSKFLARRLVELDAAIEHLDAGAQSERMSVAHGQILASVKRFFGLDADGP
jgi:CRP-like cAMP-binding protein